MLVVICVCWTHLEPMHADINVLVKRACQVPKKQSKHLLHVVHNRHCVAPAWKHWRLCQWETYSITWFGRCCVLCNAWNVVWTTCGREPLPMLRHIITLCFWMSCFCSFLAMRWHCCHVLMSPRSEYAPEMMKSIWFDVPTGLERIRGSDITCGVITLRHVIVWIGDKHVL